MVRFTKMAVRWKGVKPVTVQVADQLGELFYDTLLAEVSTIDRSGTPIITPMQQAGMAERQNFEATLTNPIMRYCAGLARGLSIEVAARVGCQLATYALETTGTQEYVTEPVDFCRRLAESYGPDTAARVWATWPDVAPEPLATAADATTGSAGPS